MIVALARGARRDAVRQKFGSCMTRFVNRSFGGANDFFTDAALAVEYWDGREFTFTQRGSSEEDAAR